MERQLGLLYVNVKVSWWTLVRQAASDQLYLRARESISGLQRILPHSHLQIEEDETAAMSDAALKGKVTKGSVPITEYAVFRDHRTGPTSSKFGNCVTPQSRACRVHCFVRDFSSATYKKTALNKLLNL